MTVKQIRKVVEHINRKIDLYEKCKALNIATSVVDIRQPFFVDKASRVLTVEQKLGPKTH